MDDPSQPPLEDRQRQAKAPLVIGVGASASTMSSIERFFSKFSLGAEQALVLVLQHREAFDELQAIGTDQESGVDDRSPGGSSSKIDLLGIHEPSLQCGCGTRRLRDRWHRAGS